MADLIALSSKIIDEGYEDGSAGPLNRINHELSVLDDNIAMVEAFSHAVCFRTDAGLAVFDTSGAQGGGRVVSAIRQWTDSRKNIWTFEPTGNPRVASLIRTPSGLETDRGPSTRASIISPGPTK